MADKKVERNIRSSDEERPSTPSQKLQASISDGGTLNMAERPHNKAKAALLDRFREREQRFRRDQSDHAQAEAVPPTPGPTEREAQRE
jgi:hypothetical protein